MDRERLLAVALHPNRTGGSPASGFPVHGLDGLAQALDSRFWKSRTSRAGLQPRSSRYEDSDPDWPFPHQPWFPDLRHLNFQTFHLQPSAVLDQTRSTPSALAALFRSGFAVALAGSPKPPTQSSSPVSVYRDVLRTARSLPVAFHPGVSPRRSYFQLLALK